MTRVGPTELGQAARFGRPAATSARSLSVIVLTLNEERHLPACLASLRWAEHVLVFDSGSTDRTAEIALSAGAMMQVHPFENYSRQRQAALEAVASEWVLFIDADERVPLSLAAEIQAALRDPQHNAYWIPRRNVFWGHAMRGGGWWPDRQLRLLRRDASRYDPTRAVHELAEVTGSCGALTVAMDHINYESPKEFRAKQRSYLALESDRRIAAGRRPKTRAFVLQPAREFLRRYVHLGGWRDGTVGAYVCALMAWYELRTLLAQRAALRKGLIKQ